MSRIIIELPEHFSFRHEVVLTSQHMNIGNHLDNAELLKVVGEARVAYWTHLGYTPFDLEGVSNILADAALQYQSEGLCGETLVIEQAIKDFNKYGFDVVWRLSEKTSGREVARGKHGILCFDYTAKKVALVPEKLRDRLEAEEKKAAL
jgi:4-hydroxybenzoyl-CoA thioesterase